MDGAPGCRKRRSAEADRRDHGEDDGDHEDREGRRHPELQLGHLLEDAHRDQGPVDGDEEDRGADGGHGADEDDAQPGEEGRQRSSGSVTRRKVVPRRGPEALRGLLDGGVDLLEDRHRGADARRAVAEDVAGHDDRAPCR